ncbi:MAG TPA: lanthionine synthetase LanC family protein [Longimicrobium sp.]|nr:lanthionine synthetase LanC family protein [Longimicrobium sp.]
MQPDATRLPFLETAAGLGARLCREAVWAGGRCNWVGDAQEPSAAGMAVVQRALAPVLYEGTSGVALFLARLYQATGERPFRTAAEGALRQALSQTGRVPAPLAVALHSGLTGITWALAESADALGEARWTEEAARLAEQVESAEPDPRATDVITGGAGAIPVLLGLARRLERPGLAETALRHGEFLLGRARQGEHGWSWPSIDMPTRGDLTGYSHGAAGFALALQELGIATGDERFRHAAEQGFRYEARAFDPQQGNWPDHRIFGDPRTAPATPQFAMAWCHGAPGIGLSRLRAWQLTASDARLAEARAALATTVRALEAGVAAPSYGFSLCHGDAGNAELPLLAAQLLGAPELAQVADRVGWAGIERFASPGQAWPCGVPSGGETPSLMLGLAGIGYFYLRLYDPAGVPSVLLVTPEPAARPVARSEAWAAAVPA